MFGISIVICCYNSADRLPETLKYIANQKVSKDLLWEVIVVNNASKDNTVEVTYREWQKYNCSVALQVIEQPIPGLSFAREKGVESSKYDYILFCDDDNWLSPDYLMIGASVINSSGDIGIIGGRGEVVSDTELPDWYPQYSSYYATFPQADKSGYLESATGAVYGAGMFIKKEVFQRLKSKGFESILTDRKGTSLSSGGDYELSYAAKLVGYQLYYDERLVFKHFIPGKRLTLNYLLNLTSSIGYSSAQLALYEKILKGQKVDHLTWFKDFLYKIKYVVNAFLLYVFKRGDSLDLKVGLLNSVRQLKSIWDQREVYLKRYNKIKNLVQ